MKFWKKKKIPTFFSYLSGFKKTALWMLFCFEQFYIGDKIAKGVPMNSKFQKRDQKIRVTKWSFYIDLP